MGIGEGQADVFGEGSVDGGVDVEVFNADDTENKEVFGLGLRVKDALRTSSLSSAGS